ncbi:MAG TPA: fasciclin domain-containing protein [Puia sp.]|nr:fasciclin domain-containing protein [Puia sp.]
MRAKNYAVGNVFIGFAVCGLFLGSCVKSAVPNTNTKSNTITAVITNSSNATLTDTAFTRAGLDSMFNNGGPFTFFVATDAAWLLAGISDTTFDRLPDSVIRHIILYNTIPQSLSASQLPTGPDSPLKTLSGDTAFITSNGAGIFFDGIQIESTDLIASNGLIDAMAQLVLPPFGTVQQVLQADSSTTYLAAAIARTSAAQLNIGTVLSSGVFTVFAPSNQAFRNAGFASISDINNANPDSLSTILIYHLVPKRVFTTDINTSLIEPTLVTNKTITFGSLGNGNFAVLGAGNANPSPIIASNIMAYKGVIHVITQVLIP